MDDIIKQMLTKVMEDKHSGAKALAHFMFREIVEDIHAEGKITDEEMKDLNKAACNRAAFLSSGSPFRRIYPRTPRLFERSDQNGKSEERVIIE